MGKKNTFGILAVLFFSAILFMPSDSEVWIYLALIGVIFAIGWVVNND